MPEMKKYLEAGRLGAPRGIKGELRFDCWCDSPDFLADIGTFYLDSEGKHPLEVASYRASIPTVTFKGYEDRGLASTLTNRTLWFDREDITLPDGVCFNDDLIGLDVFSDADGSKYGTLDAIEDGARCNMYIIKGGGVTYRVPDVDRYILRRDPKRGIFTASLEGLEE